MEIESNESLVNLASLRNLLGGSTEGITEILTMFTEHIPPSIIEIRKLLANQEWYALRKKIHSIKSYYGYVGNDFLNQKLNDWESALIEKPASFNHADTMNELERKTVSILERLRQILQEGIQ